MALPRVDADSSTGRAAGRGKQPERPEAADPREPAERRETPDRRKPATEQRRYNRRSPVSDVAPPYYETFDRIATALERIQTVLEDRFADDPPEPYEPSPTDRLQRQHAQHSVVPPARGGERR